MLLVDASSIPCVSGEDLMGKCATSSSLKRISLNVPEVAEETQHSEAGQGLNNRYRCWTETWRSRQSGCASPLMTRWAND